LTTSAGRNRLACTNLPFVVRHGSDSIAHALPPVVVPVAVSTSGLRRAVAIVLHVRGDIADAITFSVERATIAGVVTRFIGSSGCSSSDPVLLVSIRAYTHVIERVQLQWCSASNDRDTTSPRVRVVSGSHVELMLTHRRVVASAGSAIRIMRSVIHAGDVGRRLGS